MKQIWVVAAGVLLAALLYASPGRAYTPESGVWWNPAEPGYGIQLEIQDNFAAVFLFTYDAAGNDRWYTATGFLDGNARFVSTLDGFRNGTCLGCTYRPNTLLANAGGPIEILFNADDPTRATMYFGGRTVPLERFHFYLQRPEDQLALPGVAPALTKMMGEWQLVLDFSDNPIADFRFYGEIVILDVLDSDSGGDFVDGCRAADSQIGFCRAADADEHRAVIEYVAETGEHVLVIENSATTYAAYWLRVGTNELEGEMSVYPVGSNPSVFYPVNGFRTASRTFVEEGVGPSKRTSGDHRGDPDGLPLAAADGHAKTLDAGRAEVLARLQQRLAGAAAAR